ncbi:DUF2793 domain-containing protein [Defluviimonas sp. D31]|uniref:DUF2793 domain-containing protein n=1 Tax=Defluviimonas sp. D31 TaxID=3083253 RepID=UPI00296E6626|nr:DUF2793 domain-containing protein [Defluviimonas sp. D31]MDW4551508.1 DUF2793 domain-containing protein [Defluviimonas sp. D31]
MSDTTTHLGLPYLMAAQAQKHVTHNEALRLLDAMVQLSVLDRTRTAPPASPADGDRHLVAPGATGLWTGWDLNVAFRVDGAWMRLVPRPGWLAWIAAEQAFAVWNGSAWTTFADAFGWIAPGPNVTIARGPYGASAGLAVQEELLSPLAGPSHESTIVIPDRAIVLGVSTRTVEAITGASSYDCGIPGEPGKFGGSLGVAPGNSNIGVIGPQAFYADTPIRLTANGADFSGGAVRIAVHTLTFEAPET